jgi:hypothetical protein
VFVSPESNNSMTTERDTSPKKEIFQEISKTLRKFKKDKEMIDSLIEFLRTFEICCHSEKKKKKDKFCLFPLLMEDNIPMEFKVPEGEDQAFGW